MSPAEEFVAPAYRDRSLADLLPSIAAQLGVPGYGGTLELPDARTYVVVLVDGLGYEQLLDHALQAPELAALARGSRPLTACFPSTTATSLTSIGTGMPPGQHGIAGYRFRLPDTGEVISPLTWDTAASPELVQPKQTVFEALAAHGLASTQVVPARFEHTGLTQAALRGATVVGLADEDDDEDRIRAAVEATIAAPGIVYCYYRALDHTGHCDGVGSATWRARLSMVEGMCLDLRDELDDDVALLVTGDHGMVDVPLEHRFVIEDEPDLIAGVDVVAGEGRMRQLYTGEPSAVATRWGDVVGERALVVLRDEAIEAGWLGPVSASARERFGDVLVLLRDDWAAMTRTQPKEFGLVGMHGSLTPAEMYVPLLAL